MNYTKLSLPVLMVAAALSVQGRQLTPEEALQRLSSGNSEAIKRIPGIKETPQLANTYYDTEGKPCLYMFDSATGFVILSADDCAEALLAYSDTPLPSDKDMPENMRQWLQGYVEQISLASAAGYTFSAAPSTTSSRSSISPLVSTQWDQNYPYNSQCPYYDNYYRCVTGCTATAAAQIMYTHKYPLTGQGVFTHTDEINGRTDSWTVDFGATTYDWASMQDKYSYNDSEASEAAVSTLMKHLGVSFQMNYGFQGSNQSGASLANAALGLIRNFNYSPGVCHRWQLYYSDEEWRQMLYDELAAGRPLLYEGVSDYGDGHAFVCDGYDSNNNRFHFNWGWSGSGNGYYALTALTPSTDWNNYNYTNKQAAIFGIRPPQENDKSTPFMFTEGDIVPQDVINDSKSLKLIVTNTTNTAFFSGVTCLDQAKINPGLELVSKATGEKYYIQGTKEMSLKYLYGTYTFEVTGNLTSVPAGDYTARPIIRVNYNGTYSDWDHVLAPFGYESSFNMHVGKYFTTSYNDFSTKSLLTAKDVQVPSQAEYGEQFILKAIIDCAYADFKGNISVICRTLDGKSYNISSSQNVVIKKGESITVDIPCTLQFSGSDVMDICLAADRKIFYDDSTITPEIDPVSATVTADSKQIRTPEGENFVISGTMNIEGGAGTRYGNIECVVKDNSGKVYSKAEQSLYIYPGISKDFAFSMPAISTPGSYAVCFNVEDKVIDSDITVEVTSTSGLSSVDLDNELRVVALSSGDRMLAGTRAADVITVYSTDGKICFNGVANSDNFTLPTASWPRGIYIVKIADKTVRFSR